MSAIFPFVDIDSDSFLCTYFLPYQVAWILAEDSFHTRKQQVFALAEKSVRIGWTFADAFKNVRKRLRFKNRDYLFATKDYPSALEYMRIAKEFADICDITKAIVSHGEEYLKAPAESSGLTREFKMSYIKFDTGSRIIAFSAHPQAMAVYGGDVAASGQGDLAAFYIDEARADDLWLRALLTCRTEGWDFIRTVLFYFLDNLPRVQAAGDESGLGRQICWEAANQRSYRFQKVNFTAKKHDLGFTLMNQLATAQKHFPRDHHDIAADFFALRKIHNGTKWVFTEGRNTHNTASHCDIAWAAALATFAHLNDDTQHVCAAVIMEDGSVSRFGHRANRRDGDEVSELDHPTVWRPRKL
jgi:phage FluMu gp28-like protein